MKAHSLSSVLSKSFGSLGVETKLTQFHLAERWSEIIGSPLDEKCVPNNIIGKTLYLTVSSSAWMTELTYLKQEILSRVNKALSSKLDSIKFRIGKVEKPAKKRPPKLHKEKRELSATEHKFIENAVSAIKNPELRETIQRAMEKGKETEEE